MIFDPETSKKLTTSQFLKGSDFEDEGVVLIFKGFEKTKGRFGAPEDSKMVEKGILEEGESFRYVFEDVEGTERIFDSHSMPFAVAMNQAEVNEGDKLHITRTGKTTETRYQVEHVETF